MTRAVLQRAFLPTAQALRPGAQFGPLDDACAGAEDPNSELERSHAKVLDQCGAALAETPGEAQRKPPPEVRRKMAL